MGLKFSILNKRNIKDIIIEKKHFFSQVYKEVIINYENKIENIGIIEYNIISGQISYFFINEEYRNIGIGKKIVDEIIKDLKQNNTQYVWLYDRENHPFWLNIGFDYIEKNLYRLEI